MKRMVLLLLCGAFVLLLSGCGSQPVQEKLPSDVEAETQEPLEPEAVAPPEEPITEPETEPESESVTVTLYYGDENAEHILSREEQVAEVTPQVLADLLYDQGVFSHSFAVNSCKVEEGVLKLDLDEHFEEMLQSTGTAGEYIMMGSLVNTFLDAYEAEGVDLTVNGEILETGHSIYDWILTFYES